MKPSRKIPAYRIHIGDMVYFPDTPRMAQVDSIEQELRPHELPNLVFRDSHNQIIDRCRLNDWIRNAKHMD